VHSTLVMVLSGNEIQLERPTDVSPAVCRRTVTAMPTFPVVSAAGLSEVDRGCTERKLLSHDIIRVDISTSGPDPHR
jgi:hypothetical protein